MKVFPAIDISDGKCIRLTKGNINNLTKYNDNPIDQAKYFYEKGAEQIHIVDIDATLSRGDNSKILEKIKNEVPIFVQVAGGIRDDEKITQLLNAGFDCLVIGTLAQKNLNFLDNVQKIHHKKISIALDLLDKKTIATHGWTKKSENDLQKIISHYKNFDINSFFVTDVNNDGTLKGLNFDTFSFLKENTNKDIIIGGGVKDMTDVSSAKIAGFQGLIVGKAIYENKLILEELLSI